MQRLSESEHISMTGSENEQRSSHAGKQNPASGSVQHCRPDDRCRHQMEMLLADTADGAADDTASLSEQMKRLIQSGQEYDGMLQKLWRGFLAGELYLVSWTDAADQSETLVFVQCQEADGNSDFVWLEADVWGMMPETSAVSEQALWSMLDEWLARRKKKLARGLLVLHAHPGEPAVGEGKSLAPEV